MRSIASSERIIGKLPPRRSVRSDSSTTLGMYSVEELELAQHALMRSPNLIEAHQREVWPSPSFRR
jgi:hypothetical protein